MYYIAEAFDYTTIDWEDDEENVRRKEEVGDDAIAGDEEAAVEKTHAEDDDCDDDEDYHEKYPSEFWSYGNSMALNFFMSHWILSELYRRDKIDALFQVYLKYSHVTGVLTMLTYAFEVLYLNYAAIFGVGFFAYGYKKYYELWRSVDAYVDARNVKRYLDKYENSSDDDEELDEFQTPEDFPEETAVEGAVL